ncbi:cell wall hydrolase [Aurantiacibacter sp. D1-12]|uniref:cell wall hydrolase n=1 Tax=Aurantiacibacter sp. D1-12 TaxID=2993658 RepID=UPI00237D1C55|nr:cell wall hydrolase [Aurantiacibacter sp. D1-12]MDE1468118.1 cell wall hydrolase [Aurantiacibacter sp. D1-12]
MKITWKRAGALALVSTVIASSFGTATSGAIAQDQTVPAAAEQVATDFEAPQDAAEPQVRFVASEVVQDVPEEPEVQTVDAASLRDLVATVDTSGEMSREVMCLAQAVYFESRGEPLDGQLAVARVIINRAESNRFPDDYCSVVTQRSQFSFVRNGHIPTPNAGSSAWGRAKAIARIAHRDMWESEADDALYFHATHVRPSWARRMTTRARIDNHIFYR